MSQNKFPLKLYILHPADEIPSLDDLIIIWAKNKGEVKNTLRAWFLEGKLKLSDGHKYTKDEYTIKELLSCWNIEKVELPLNLEELNLYKYCCNGNMECGVIFAESKQECLDKLYEAECNPSFIEYVNNTSANMSFAERFFHDDNGYLFDENAKPRADIRNRFCYKTDKIKEYIHNTFENNARRFFGKNLFFANLYLKYYVEQNTTDTIHTAIIPNNPFLVVNDGEIFIENTHVKDNRDMIFPKEMYLYCIKNDESWVSFVIKDAKLKMP